MPLSDTVAATGAISTTTLAATMGDCAGAGAGVGVRVGAGGVTGRAGSTRAGRGGSGLGGGGGSTRAGSGLGSGVSASTTVAVSPGATVTSDEPGWYPLLVSRIRGGPADTLLVSSGERPAGGPFGSSMRTSA